MRHIGPHHMIGFTNELGKEAGLGSRVGGLVKKHLGGKYLRQVGVGAGVGALGGAAADKDNRLRGALGGAALGAGIGGASVLARKGGREAIKKSLGKTREKLTYGLTGKTVKGDKMTPEYAREIGIIPKKVNVMEGPLRPKELAKQTKALALEGTHEKALAKGWQTVPGVLHGAVTSPGQLLRSGWQRAGTTGKAFAGLGAYESGKGFLKKPEEGGPGRLEAGMRGLGSTAGWLVAPGGMVAGSLVGQGAGSLAGKVGKGVGAAANAARSAGQLAQYAAQPRQFTERGAF